MTTEAIEWIGAVGIIATVAAITFALNRCVDALDHVTDEASKLYDAIHKSANALLDDARTPLSVAEFVVQLSKDATKPDFAEWFIARHGDFHEPQPKTPFAKDLDSLPPELASVFVANVLCALFASALAKPLQAKSRRERVGEILTDASKRFAETTAVRESEPVMVKVNPRIFVEVNADRLGGPQVSRVPEPMRWAVSDYREEHRQAEPMLA